MLQFLKDTQEQSELWRRSHRKTLNATCLLQLRRMGEICSQAGQSSLLTQLLSLARYEFGRSAGTLLQSWMVTILSSMP